VRGSASARRAAATRDAAMPAAEKESRGDRKFLVGDAVQYNSSTVGTWLDCTVKKVNSKGHVEVTCKPGHFVEPSSDKLRRRWEYGGERYREGEAVQFYSETYKTWVDTVVSQVRSGGEVEVMCKQGHWVPPAEMAQKLRRPPTAAKEEPYSPAKRQPETRRAAPYGRGVAGRALGMLAAKGTGKGAHHSDRSRTCPFLLRVFHKVGSHHELEDFAQRGSEPVDDELQVYTWPDVTLRELADLVKDVAPEARTLTARLNFRLIYPDKAGRNVMMELGTVSAVKRSPDDLKRLSESKFQKGDLIDLAIYP